MSGIVSRLSVLGKVWLGLAAGALALIVFGLAAPGSSLFFPLVSLWCNAALFALALLVLRRAGVELDLFHKAVLVGLWAAAVLYFYWTLGSRTFLYHWDYVNYILKQYHAEAAFAQSTGAGFRFLLDSITEDYTNFITLFTEFPFCLSGNTEALVNVKKEFGENPYELKNILKYWIRSKNEDLKVIPTDSIVMKVDKEAVRRSGMMIPGDSIPDYMHISLKGKRALYKSELMMLEMLAEANWERPIYIAVSVGPENQLNMGNHFIQEGLTYRFTPFDTDKLGVKIDSEKMYDNLMHKFKFGGIDKPGIYIDENAMRMCHSHRRIFSQLAQQLIREGKKDKAKAALDYAEKMIPAFNVPYDWQNGAVQMAEAYYQLGDSTKADDMMKALADKAVEYLTWYLSMDDNRFSISTREFEYHWAVLDAEVKIMRKYNSKLAEIYAPKVEELYNLYAERYERLQKMEKK